MMTSSRPLQSRGFSLIELSVVLIIIGILLSLTIPALTPNIKRAAELKARTLLGANVDSLVGYAGGNRQLPTVTTYKSALRSITDGFSDSSEFQFVYDSRLNSADSICNYPGTYLTVIDCGTRNAGACDSSSNNDGVVTNVAFALVSAGSDGNNQTAASAGVSTATEIKIYRYDNVGEDGYTADKTAGSNDPYDDYVAWATLAELQRGAGCSGTPIQILTSGVLPSGTIGTDYSTRIYANGGGVSFPAGGDYKWCVADESSAGKAWSDTAIEIRTYDGSTLSTTDLAMEGTPTDPCPADKGDSRWVKGNSLNLYKAAGPTTSGAFKLRIKIRDYADGSDPVTTGVDTNLDDENVDEVVVSFVASP